MAIANKEGMLKVRSILNRRYIDSSMVNIQVIGGSVHFTGVLRNLRQHPGIDLKSEMEHISLIIRQQPGLRDVVWEVSIRA